MHPRFCPPKFRGGSSVPDFACLALKDRADAGLRRRIRTQLRHSRSWVDGGRSVFGVPGFMAVPSVLTREWPAPLHVVKIKNRPLSVAGPALIRLCSFSRDAIRHRRSLIFLR